MAEDVFRFKHFEAAHYKSSMKIGVDAVLLGAWAGIEAKKILEVGTGCGVIALALAQRFPDAQILAIDVDAPSVEEATCNFRNSKWGKRIKCKKMSFPNDLKGYNNQFDIIVSNPPFFNAGLKNPSTPRERARHQDTLSVFTLLENAGKYLSDKGRLAMIFPSEFKEEVMERALRERIYLQRECLIRNKATRPEKRVMMEFGLYIPTGVQTEHLILFEEGLPTEAYQNLCKDFYLKF